MPDIIWIVIAFFCGALPFSVWIGRVGLGKDITQYGDGNPGAANVWRSGGAGWGTVAILMDFLKGAIPVGAANLLFDVHGYSLAAVAVAPITGHAFSPFLRFRGGKALAVTFGVWAGLTVWFVPTILGLFFGIYLYLFEQDGWAVMFGLVTLLVVLSFAGYPTWLAAWAGTTVVLGWKHRAELAERPLLRGQSERRHKGQ